MDLDAESVFFFLVFPAVIAVQGGFLGFFSVLGLSMISTYLRLVYLARSSFGVVKSIQEFQLAGGGTGYDVTVEYRDFRHRLVTAQSLSSFSISPVVGERLEILYFEDRPDRFELKSKTGSWAFFGVAPLVFTALVVFYGGPRLPSLWLLAGAVGYLVGVFTSVLRVLKKRKLRT